MPKSLLGFAVSFTPETYSIRRSRDRHNEETKKTIEIHIGESGGGYVKAKSQQIIWSDLIWE